MHHPTDLQNRSDAYLLVTGRRPIASSRLLAESPRQIDGKPRPFPAVQRTASAQRFASVDPFPMPSNWETLAVFDSADLSDLYESSGRNAK